MKHIFSFIAYILIFLMSVNFNQVFAQFTGTGSNSETEYVEGYYRDDGTYVEGYYRTEKNDYNLDNFSAKGNYNPYTGETGDKIYDSPYNSLHNKDYDIDKDDYKLKFKPSDEDIDLSDDFNIETNTNSNTTYFVKSNGLNVRRGPSTDYSVKFSLDYGEKITLVKKINNNWVKIKHKEEHVDVYETKTETKNGFVHKSYIESFYPTTSNSNEVKENNKDNFSGEHKSYDAISYSSIENKDLKNGKLTVYTNCKTCDHISIYINGEFAGKLTLYIDDRPSCGDHGTFTITKQVGIYTLKATDGNGNLWQGNVKIKPGKCNIIGLKK